MKHESIGVILLYGWMHTDEYMLFVTFLMELLAIWLII